MSAITLPRTEDLQQETTLRDCVRLALDRYFANLEGEDPVDLYSIVLEEIEVPLLEVVMRKTRNNQVKAAKLLGIARGTLRAKLKKYGMLE